jgi:hypothetical protein
VETKRKIIEQENATGAGPKTEIHEEQLRSGEGTMEKMDSTQDLKSVFSLKFKQVYNKSTEVTVILPSFDYWNIKFVLGPL